MGGGGGRVLSFAHQHPPPPHNTPRHRLYPHPRALGPAVCTQRRVQGRQSTPQPQPPAWGALARGGGGGKRFKGTIRVPPHVTTTGGAEQIKKPPGWWGAPGKRWGSPPQNQCLPQHIAQEAVPLLTHWGGPGCTLEPLLVTRPPPPSSRHCWFEPRSRSRRPPA
ncbi:UV excision repair protein RAD23-like protein B [Platysternon megacephalum]|uniref:UV excision repair protein RAD23-like protein B n=1 Tax=Platysternon megacephalum TaxID=55544 RepID=A0A4D9DZ52_9SAUR|nr:UV excision repair protein RAD23-like protein B [Platysternon megacephalum]